MRTFHIDYAFNLGRQFAAQLNDDSKSGQDWSYLEQGDDVPEFDYLSLKQHYANEFEDNIKDIECAYKSGFNSVFAPF